MGTKNWFHRLKRFFGSDAKTNKEKKDRRKRWFFGRLNSKCSPALPAPSSLGSNTLREAEEEQSKHAVAVAVATAAAAEAAVAAAHAAAQVVRLTGTPLSHQRSREVAAIKIQTAFRGYLARRALRALKGLVKLQALIRGQAVRRQTSITLKSLQCLMKIQSQAHANRAKMIEDNWASDYKANVDQETKELENWRAQLHLKIQKRWDSSILSKEEVESILKSRYKAALKRERAIQYASSYQERRSMRRLSTPAAEFEANLQNPRWSWLEQWVGMQPSEKDIPEILPTPRSYQITSDGQLHVPDTPVCLASVGNNDNRELSHLVSLARRSFTGPRRTSLLDDDDSFTTSPSFPSYMASTASTKARFRSMSTPKLRMSSTDTCSEHCLPYTSRLRSPYPSIASDASFSKTGRNLPVVHQKSPRLRGQTSPVKPRRSSNYRSFDSECSLLNWDQRSTIR